MRRQELLQATRTEIPAPAAVPGESRLMTAAVEAIRVLNGRSAVARRFEQLQRSAWEEMLILDKPPYANPKTNVDGEKRMLAAGPLLLDL